MSGSDPVSGIKSGEVGLGRSRRDTYLLAWSPVSNFSHVEFNYQIPDGVPAWVKTRVTNNGTRPVIVTSLVIVLPFI